MNTYIVYKEDLAPGKYISNGAHVFKVTSFPRVSNNRTIYLVDMICISGSNINFSYNIGELGWPDYRVISPDEVTLLLLGRL